MQVLHSAELKRFYIKLEARGRRPLTAPSNLYRENARSIRAA